MKRKEILTTCPVCNSSMVISELRCESCGTSVKGKFKIPILCQLPSGLYEFLLVFVKNRGVIREVEQELGISYPTVKARLDAVLAALRFGDQVRTADREHIIGMLEQGEISAEEAEKLLRGETEEK
ncbi:hypothetical protein CH330_02965 [candidate division WOR-3 bacterium JGI_Cruoil_03_51_56]|uniref:DUF2089 domain-containing protein n=1 Tax=candidate division WOR-3 bacterium JGI_Cruoil_03_51_56 TaxID=1973747 RepID=A0A235BVX5_UNCW3|nr:MAG: hypothetical protein CH330_02965 [candidate division WOR-3 bacterium JGI_Cruoil_03_51_56]